MTIPASRSAAGVLPRRALRVRPDAARPRAFWWWLPFLLALAAGAATYLVAASEADFYRSRASLNVPVESALPGSDYAALATSAAVLNETIAALDLSVTADELRAALRAQADGTLIELQTDAATPDAALLLATTVTNLIIRESQKSLGAPPPVPLGGATLPSHPAGPEAALPTALAVAAALLLGIVVSAIPPLIGRPHRSPIEVEELTGLRTFGLIPVDPKMGADALFASPPRSPQAEASRALRRAVEVERGARALRTILIAGAEPGIGATHVAVILALAFADAGRTTILLDADLRAPTLHRLLGFPNDRGFTSTLLGEPPRPLPVQPLAAAPLRVVPSGPPPLDPAALLDRERIRAALAALKETAELTILTTAPTLAAADDAAALAAECDAVLVVVAEDRTTAEPLRHAQRTLNAVGTPILGAVLT